MVRLAELSLDDIVDILESKDERLIRALYDAICDDDQRREVAVLGHTKIMTREEMINKIIVMVSNYVSYR